MHSVTEMVVATAFLTSWVWMMVLVARKFGPEMLANVRRNRARKAAMKPVARVEYTGEGNDFDVFDLDGRFLYGVTLPYRFGVCTYPDGTVTRDALALLNERAIERYTDPTPVTPGLMAVRR